MAYGWEFLYKFTKYPFNISTSYTLGWSYKTVEGWTYFPKYDSRHNITLSFNYNFGDGWSSGILWLYNSGLPFTPSNGYYDKFIFEDMDDYNSQYEGYNQNPLLGDLNSMRLPDYHRLDFGINKVFDFNTFSLETSLNFVNVYDRKNIFYFDRETGERINMLPFLTTMTIKLIF